MPLKILRWHSGTSTAGRKQFTAWLELFFDLIFALPIAGLAQSLYNRLTPGGFLAFAGLFLTVWWAWYSLVLFANRFESDNRLYQAILLAGMLCTIVLAVNIENTLNGLTTGFILMYAALQALTASLYLWQWHKMQEEQNRVLALRCGLGFAGAAVLWLVTIWLPVPLRYVIWGLALLVEIITPQAVALMLKSRLSPTSYLAERLAVFTLILFGTLTIQSGIGLVGTPWQVSSAATAISGFIIAVCLWWLYFSYTDTVVPQPSSGEDRQEAVRSLHSLTHMLTWCTVYLLIYGSLTVTSVGIVL
ncbi:MAG: low temperature requirement protein A, partial [Ktedonobacteraceae bacterium]|nr:low temperature requirement protein A [Ktedonobacteraceae bacterium]